MKQKIKIIQENNTLFSGRIADMPIKDEAIIKKSIELFDDEDPCIIHQSYVIKEYVDILLNIFKQTSQKTIKVLEYKEELAFLNIADFTNVIIMIEG